MQSKDLTAEYLSHQDTVMRGRKLLIVDDEQDIINTLQNVLLEDGYEIETALSSQEALHKIELFPAEIVVTDYIMPDMNGIELLKQIKQIYPHIIPILLTGKSELKISFRAINQGDIFRFLLKPWNNEELRVILRIAFQYHDLILENKRLLDTVNRQSSLLDEIEKKYPGITKFQKEEDGTLIIEDEECSDPINTFQIQGK